MSVVKTDFGGDLRRITIEPTDTFSQIYQRIKQLYSLKGVKLSYLDEDKDKVLIGTDLELRQALEFAGKGSLKILVEEGPELDENDIREQDLLLSQISTSQMNAPTSKQETKSGMNKPEMTTNIQDLKGSSKENLDKLQVPSPVQNSSNPLKDASKTQPLVKLGEMDEKKSQSSQGSMKDLFDFLSPNESATAPVIQPKPKESVVTPPVQPKPKESVVTAPVQPKPEEKTNISNFSALPVVPSGPVNPVKPISPANPQSVHPFTPPAIVVDANAILLDAKFSQQVRDLVKETLLSQPVMDVLIQEMKPRLSVLIQEHLMAQGKPEPVSQPPIFIPPQFHPMPTNPLSQLLQQPTNVVPLQPSPISPQPNVVSSQPPTSQQSPPSSLFESIIKDTKEVIETIFPSPETPTAPQNPPPKENPPTPTKENAPREDNLQEDDAFVLLDDQPVSSSPPEKKTLGGLLSSLNPFNNKGNQGSPPPSAPAPTSPQKPEAEVPEPLLKQLEDMGFTNREENIRVARFHQRYNEGLNEILEDLLTQSQLAQLNKK